MLIEWGAFLEGLKMLASPGLFVLVALGVAFGIITGAIPGFTTSLAIAMMLPITFKMPIIESIVFLMGIYTGGCFGGSISAILLGIPGTPQAVVTANDGYPMNKQGKANEALGLAVGASTMGTILGAIFLILVMQPLVNITLKFGPAEMFMVAVFGLTIIASLQEGGLIKGLLAGLFGVLLGTIGMTTTGVVRGTFGFLHLMDGIPIVPALIGFIGLPELYRMLEKEFVTDVKGVEMGPNWGKLIYGFRLALTHRVTILRSSIIGIIVGALPGAGATIASIISYNEARRWSRHPERYGKGEPDGIVASEAANNSSEGGATACMLALGIPGGTATAVLIGALMLQGLIPGPRLFIDNMPLVYGVMLSLLLSTVFLIAIGLIVSYYCAKIITVPTMILVPVIMVFSVIGTYAVRNYVFDIYITLIFSVIGYLMTRYGYPVIAVILGIILGPIADVELLKTYQRFAGDWSVFFTRPISLVLFLMSFFGVLLPFFLKWFNSRRG